MEKYEKLGTEVKTHNSSLYEGKSPSPAQMQAGIGSETWKIPRPSSPAGSTDRWGWQKKKPNHVVTEIQQLEDKNHDLADKI